MGGINWTTASVQRHALPGHLAVGFHAFDADVVTFQPLGDHGRRAAAQERIEDDASREDSRPAGRFRPAVPERRRSGLRGTWRAGSTRPCVCCGLWGETPDPNARRAGWSGPGSCPARVCRLVGKVLAAAPHAALVGERHVRFANGIGVVVVVRRLGQEENILVVGRRTRLDRGRHGVRFVPDDVAAQDPAASRTSARATRQGIPSCRPSSYLSPSTSHSVPES